MTNTTDKPVIFLAFANDRDDTVGYLRSLPDEPRRLQEVLESAERADLDFQDNGWNVVRNASSLGIAPIVLDAPVQMPGIRFRDIAITATFSLMPPTSQPRMQNLCSDICNRLLTSPIRRATHISDAMR